MKKLQEYAALRIPYGQVAWYIEKVVSMVLGRQIDCRVCRDDYDYWCATDVNQGGSQPPQENYYGSEYLDQPMF